MKLLIVLLFVPLCLFSPTLIEGVVKDSLHLPISSVNLQLLEKGINVLVDFKSIRSSMISDLEEDLYLLLKIMPPVFSSSRHNIMLRSRRHSQSVAVFSKISECV
jgi:hypothetical protein